MARPLELKDLVEHFTLRRDELDLLRGKSGATRLGFALVLKFLIWQGRFRGFRECSVAEAQKLTDWLVVHVACSERRPDRALRPTRLEALVATTGDDEPAAADGLPPVDVRALRRLLP